MPSTSWSRVFVPAVAIAVLWACSSNDSTTPGSEARADGGGGKKDGSSGNPDGDDPQTPSNRVRTDETVDVDGRSRDYVLSVPKNYDEGRSYPLLLALHGDGGTAATFVSQVSFETLVGADAIVAYPDRSEDLFTPYAENNDQRMLEEIILTLKQKYSIDGSKIWGFGYSKGAYQLNEIACKKPGLLTAMAIHAGGAPQTRDENDSSIVVCPDAIGIATFVEHGANDDLGGGEFGANYWASRASCNLSRSPSSMETCETYDDCDEGTPVVFCVIPNWGHGLYGEASKHAWEWFTSL